MKKQLLAFGLLMLFTILSLPVAGQIATSCVPGSDKAWCFSGQTARLVDGLTGFTIPTGSGVSASGACEATLTRIGLWCMDTDGSLASLRSTDADDSSGVTAVVHADATFAVVRSFTLITQDGTPNAGDVQACTYPGDSAAGCAGPGQLSSQSKAFSADELNSGYNDVLVRTDSSGQILTWCNVGSGLALGRCTWYLVGYMK